MAATQDLNRLLGAEPTVILTWPTLLERGLHGVAPDQHGLYAVVRTPDEVVYVGRSYVLNLRVGAFISSLLSRCPEPHAAGARVLEHGIRPSELAIHVFMGMRPYFLELACITELRPLLNSESTMRREIVPIVDGRFEDPPALKRAVQAQLFGRQSPILYE